MCEQCEPLEQGNWKSDITESIELIDRDKIAKVTLSKIHHFTQLSIYPKPYKASNFYDIGIRHCPFCGERLNTEQEGWSL